MSVVCVGPSRNLISASLHIFSQSIPSAVIKNTKAKTTAKTIATRTIESYTAAKITLTSKEVWSSSSAIAQETIATTVELQLMTNGTTESLTMESTAPTSSATSTTVEMLQENTTQVQDPATTAMTLASATTVKMTSSSTSTSTSTSTTTTSMTTTVKICTRGCFF
jgi:hypothetical protein